MSPISPALPRLLALLALLTLLTASACEKTNDVARLQDDAVATAKTYQERLDELAHRAAAIGKRGNTLPPGTPDRAEAQRMFQHVLTSIDEQARHLRQLPGLAQTDARSGDVERLEQRIAALHQQLDDRLTELISEVAALESWIAQAKQRQTHPTGSSAPLPPPPPAPAGEDDVSGAAPGSAAPIR